MGKAGAWGQSSFSKATQEITPATGWLIATPPGLAFQLDSQILMKVSPLQHLSLYTEKPVMSTVPETALELSTPLYGLLGHLLYKAPKDRDPTLTIPS